MLWVLTVFVIRRHFIWLEPFPTFCLPRGSSSVKETVIYFSSFQFFSLLKQHSWIASVTLKIDWQLCSHRCNWKRHQKLPKSIGNSVTLECVTTPPGDRCAKTKKEFAFCGCKYEFVQRYCSNRRYSQAQYWISCFSIAIDIENMNCKEKLF